MPRPAHRHKTLGEVSDLELEAMLAESETLFVEHKGNLDPRHNFDFAKAVASFANTLGGWVLIGITDGEPNEGVDGGWTAPAPHALIDRVRQALESQIDPLPSFSAAIRTLRGRRVGVVRIYESADTPHILRNGSVVVREPAQAKDLRALGRAEAKPIATHYELTQLAQRGERARAQAEDRFAEGTLPFVDASLGLKYTTAASAQRVFRTIHAEGPAVVVRATPLAMTRMFEDWASSLSAEEGCRRAAVDVVGHSDTEDPDVAARSVSVSAKGRETEPLTGRGLWRVKLRATAVADAGGAVAVRVAYSLIRTDSEPDDPFEFQRERFVEKFLKPPVVAVARLLQNAELFGRYLWHLYLLRVGDLVSVEGGRRPGFPADIPLGGEVTVPAFDETEGGANEASPDLRATLTRWGHETSRAVGIRSWPAAP